MKAVNVLMSVIGRDLYWGCASQKIANGAMQCICTAVESTEESGAQKPCTGTRQLTCSEIRGEMGNATRKGLIEARQLSGCCLRSVPEESVRARQLALQARQGESGSRCG